MYARLTPLLPVHEIRRELAFYEALGFRQHVDAAEVYELEDFAALSYGQHILFGLVKVAAEVTVPAAGLVWQFEASDLDGVARAAAVCGLDVVAPVAEQPWGRRTLAIRSPAGYEVGFEDA